MPKASKEGVKGWSTHRLQDHSRATAQIIRRFSAAVAEAMSDASSVDGFVRTLDLHVVSRDHDWRLVFAALQGESEDYEQHKLVALRRYLQYLYSRQDILAYVREQRAGLEETSEREDPTEPSATTLARLKRLPAAETVAVLLPKRGSLGMRLGRHTFRLSDRSPPRLVDENGNSYPLRRGRQTVGRHPECDVPLDPNLRDVSRVHMVIEWRERDCLQVTDLSSHGIFVDRDGLVDESTR
jgi:hypothetical protein